MKGSENEYETDDKENNNGIATFASVSIAC